MVIFQTSREESALFSDVVPVPQAVEFKMATGCKFLSLAASESLRGDHFVCKWKVTIFPMILCYYANCLLYAPTLVIQRKWNVHTRNLRLGDVVIVADRNVLRGEYRLGIVKEVFPDADGKVRRVLVTYKNF